MDHEQFDILLSAYLDGELNAAEQVRVEELLASNAEARQLVEELRALRAGLQSLPQHRLEVNFADRVLQLAATEDANSENNSEKSDSDASSTTLANLSEHTDAVGSDTEVFPRPQFWRNPRGLAWAAVAVAIALIISFANRPAEQRQVAQGPKPAAELSKEASGKKTQELTATPPTGLGDLSARDSGFANAAPRSAADAAVPATGVADKSSLVDSNGGSGGAAFGGKVQADAVSRKATDEDRQKVADDGLATQAIAGKADNYVGNLLLFEIQVSPEASQGREFERLLAANKIQLDTSFAADGGAAVNQPALTEESLNKQLRGAESKFGGGALIAEHDAEDNKRAPSTPSLGARGLIQGGGQSAATPAQPSESEVVEGKVDAKTRVQDGQDKSANDFYWYDQAKALPEVALRRLSEDGQADVVYVEASPQQIAATIDALRSTPNLFTVVSTEPEAAKKLELSDRLRREVADRAPRSETQSSVDARSINKDQTEATGRLGKVAEKSPEGARADANRFDINADQPAAAESRLRSLVAESQTPPVLGRAIRLNLAGQGGEQQQAPAAKNIAENIPANRFGGGGGGFRGQASNSGNAGEKMFRRSADAAPPPPVMSPAPQLGDREDAAKVANSDMARGKDTLPKGLAVSDLPSLGKSETGSLRQRAIFVLRVAPASNTSAGAAAAAASTPAVDPAKAPTAAPVAPPAPAGVPSAK